MSFSDCEESIENRKMIKNRWLQSDEERSRPIGSKWFETKEINEYELYVYTSIVQLSVRDCKQLLAKLFSGNVEADAEYIFSWIKWVYYQRAQNYYYCFYFLLSLSRSGKHCPTAQRQ